MHQPSRQLHRLGALFLSLIACAIVAPAASAAEGDPYLDACLTGLDTAGCTTDDFIDGAHTSALSSDGKRLYVGVIGNADGTRGNGILQFDVSPDGKLTRSACLTDNGNPSTAGDPNTRRCAFVPNLGAIAGMLVVGSNLYVTTPSGAGGTGTAILIFDGATGSGTLVKKADAAGCIRDGAAASGCDAGRSLSGIGPMAANGTGTALYVRTGDGLAVFTRSANGTLTQKPNGDGCWEEGSVTGCTDGVGLSTTGGVIRQMAVVGDRLYAPSAGYDFEFYACGGYYCWDWDFNGGISVFDIAPDGTLSQAAGTAGGCITNDGQSGAGDNVECVDGHDALIYGRAATGTGSDVYLGTAAGSGGAGANVFHFRRTGESLGDGTTVGTAASCNGTGTGCKSPGYAIRDAAWLALTPDGEELVVASESDQGLGFLQRDSATGELTQRADPKDCLTRTGHGGTCETIAALSGPATITISPNSLNLFVTGFTHDSLVTLDRDMAPVCSSTAVEVAYNTSLAVPLQCIDANGDPITLEIVQPPTNGSLAGIDRAAASVRYSPSLGYSGPDAFDFRALTRGGAVAGAAATIDISVQTPPPPPDPDKDGDGILPPVDCDDNDAAIRPTAAEIPDNAVDENCDGTVGLTPPTAAVTKITSGIASAFKARKRFTKVKRLVVRDVPAGATVEVRCRAKKGCRFRTKKVVAKTVRSVNLVRYFNYAKRVRGKRRRIVSKLRGGTIEIRITAPATIGRVATFKILKGKQPRLKMTCLPVGSARPQKSC